MSVPQTASKVVVTGAAGFIGSHLVDRLLGLDVAVLGVDRQPIDELAACRLAGAMEHPGFALVQADLAEADLDTIVAGADVVYHLAAVPGVRTSWGPNFADYASANVVGTHRLLAACERAGVRRLVYASSSSVYGPTVQPSRETDPTRPTSPYGVTKLAGEHLCLAHTARPDTTLSAVALRYFSVYGPRQRPDMAVSRMLVASLAGLQYTLFGDGTQRRDFTFVDDAVEATMAASQPHVPTSVLNVAGGASVSLIELLSIVRNVTGKPVPLTAVEAQAGDVPTTAADLSTVSALLGYHPRTDLSAGLAQQVEWLSRLPAELLTRFAPQPVDEGTVTACSR